jgi:alpha-N-arabinofuranosidase
MHRKSKATINIIRSLVVSLLCISVVVALQTTLPAPNGKGQYSAVVTFKQHASTKTIISSGMLSKSTPISSYDYGVNDVWYDNGYGSANPLTERPYQQLVSDAKTIGVSIIRYPGGNPSDTFHWEDAVGNQANRTPMVVNSGSVRNPTAVFPSTFGPAEFGALLSETNAAGDITVNFGTGTAVEAAAWVCYETAPYPDPTDPNCNQYAKMRVAAGHSAPLNIPYWEVGNEPWVKQYWRAGKVVSSPGHCQTDNGQCLYVYGGTTAFANQLVDPIQSQKGRLNRVGTPQYYIPNPPIISGSLTVSVNDSVWRQVTSQALSHSGSSAHVYAVNLTSGQIQFPNSRAMQRDRVTASYQSGPHDGFIGFYAAMKKADPNIHICETYPSNNVLQMLGSTHPYDCYVLHDYGLIGGSDHNKYTAQQFHDQSILDTQQFARQLRTSKAAITQYAGPQASNVQIVVSEYGILNYQHPFQTDVEPKNSVFHGKTAYHNSVDLGLFVADMLRSMILGGVSMAEKHYLVGYDLSLIPGIQDANDSYNFSSNAMISTVYPKCRNGSCTQPTFIMQPSAYVFEEFSKLLYGNVVASTVQNDPKVVVPRPQGNSRALVGSYPKLETLATTDGKGDEAVLVINNSLSSVSAQIRPSVAKAKSVDAWTVGGNFISYNTMAKPNVVQLHHVFTFKTTDLSAVFPPSSVTVLRF